MSYRNELGAALERIEQLEQRTRRLRLDLHEAQGERGAPIAHRTWIEPYRANNEYETMLVVTRAWDGGDDYVIGCVWLLEANPLPTTEIQNISHMDLTWYSQLTDPGKRGGYDTRAPKHPSLELALGRVMGYENKNSIDFAIIQINVFFRQVSEGLRP